MTWTIIGRGGFWCMKMTFIGFGGSRTSVMKHLDPNSLIRTPSRPLWGGQRGDRRRECAWPGPSSPWTVEAPSHGDCCWPCSGGGGGVSPETDGTEEPQPRIAPSHQYFVSDTNIKTSILSPESEDLSESFTGGQRNTLFTEKTPNFPLTVTHILCL